MRRASAVALAVALTAASASAAHAEGTVVDAVATTSVAGLVTITGAGTGLLSAPQGLTSTSTIGSASSAISGAVLTVTDATGAAAGWDVTATYAALDAAGLAAVATAADTEVANVLDLGGANVRVAASTTAEQDAANTLAAASPVAKKSGALGGAVKVASIDGDGRGITVFNTAYTLTLPAKTATAAAVYTGSVVYTVAPQAS